MNRVGLLLAAAVLATSLPAETPQPGAPARKWRPDEQARIRIVERKLEDWKLKKVAFDEATLDDALAFFKAETKKLDAEQRGLNFVVSPAAAAAAAEAKVTLALDEVPVSVALRYTVEMLHLEYRVEPFVVVIDKPPAKASP